MLIPLGGKRFKFEDQPSFFSLSGCSTTVPLLDHRHFHVLDVAVVGQIKVLGHGKTSSIIVGITIVSLHRLAPDYAACALAVINVNFTIGLAT